MYGYDTDWDDPGYRGGQGLKSWARGSEDPFGLGFDPTPIADFFSGGMASQARAEYGPQFLDLYDKYGYDGNNPLSIFSAAVMWFAERGGYTFGVGGKGTGGTGVPVSSRSTPGNGGPPRGSIAAMFSG